MNAAEKLRSLLSEDSRYDAEAYSFIYEALDFTLKHVLHEDEANNQHVTGPELLEGVRRYAIEQYGCLAAPVLESWGVRQTVDVGELVFNLIEHDLMGRQESDSKADFEDVYEFSEAFDLSPVFSYAADKEEWDAAYITRARYRAPAAERRSPAPSPEAKPH